MNKYTKISDRLGKLDVEYVKDKITVLPGDIVSLKDAGKVIGYSYHTMARSYNRPGMPKYFKRERQRYYYLKDLEDWMNNLEKVTP